MRAAGSPPDLGLSRKRLKSFKIFFKMVDATQSFEDVHDVILKAAQNVIKKVASSKIEKLWID